MMEELVARFVREQLMPLESSALAREASTGVLALLPEEQERLDALSRELRLWGLDAPAEMGGHALPVVAMVGVREERGKTITRYDLRPDSPNLRMVMQTANASQGERCLAPYARGETASAIAIWEPGAGGDPSM